MASSWNFALQFRLGDADGTSLMGADSNFREQVQELLLLQRIAQRIGSLLDLDVLLEAIVTDIAKTFGYTRSAILLKDNNDMVIAAVRGWNANVHRRGERFKVGEYGIIGHVAATGETYYAPDVLRDPYYEVSEPLTRSELDIPLMIRGELIGVFDVQTPEHDGFTPDRIRVLEALGTHIATAIDNARLFAQERMEKQRILVELEEAQAIQHALFPSRAPSLSAFSILGMCIPCRAVGGDWYDYISLRDGRVAVVVADVSGKGIAAALLMASTRSIVRLLIAQVAEPSAVLTELNKVLLNDFPRSRFVTMIYALLNPEDGSLTFASAGHNPPLLVANGEATFVESTAGIPLGIRTSDFSESRIALKNGTRLLLYSDGVPEAVSPESEEYGAARIQSHFLLAGSSIESLFREIRRFTGGVALPDDATAVLIDSAASFA